MNTVKVKTAELEGAALDYAVAKSEGDEHWTSDRNPDWFAWRMRNWKPSTDWSQCGVLIEAHKVMLEYVGIAWLAHPWSRSEHGSMEPQDHQSPLIAACRAIVASRIGDEVEIPEEILK